MYKTQAFILYSQTIRDGHIRIVLFSREYGRITAWSKSKSSPDIGSQVEVLLERKNSHNIIKKIDIISLVDTQNWSYSEIIEYLTLIAILYETLPEGLEQTSIYKDINRLFSIINSVEGKVGKIILYQYSTLKRLGFMKDGPSGFSLTHLAHVGYSPYEHELRKMVLEARHTYLHKQ